MDDRFSNWMWAGIILMAIGLVIGFATGSLPFGSVLVTIGCVVMFMAPSGTGYHYPVVQNYDSHDQHYHLHTHVYPVQRVSEGHEYTRRHPDGRTETVRYLKRSE